MDEHVHEKPHNIALLHFCTFFYEMKNGKALTTAGYNKLWIPTETVLLVVFL